MIFSRENCSYFSGFWFFGLGLHFNVLIWCTYGFALSSVRLPGFDLAIHKTMGFDGIVCSECLITVQFRVYTVFSSGISASLVTVRGFYLGEMGIGVRVDYGRISGITELSWMIWLYRISNVSRCFVFITTSLTIYMRYCYWHLH